MRFQPCPWRVGSVHLLHKVRGSFMQKPQTFEKRGLRSHLAGKRDMYIYRYLKFLQELA
jgi:hypothetical protein